MILRSAKGQSLIEYGILVLIVTAALIAMTVYLYRSSNARVRRSIDELNYYRSD
ncbi:MAG: hypothetical protein PHR84_00765 [Candidatus Omnitrophica bacterium]|jgi:Flp pilus assembly pilin Flp|nr:hypothetical protein [Candidatus Omnitrophota bacterium]MDD5661453.1 hypothetical protein [Candidatus Omnitrophota bacterium]